MDEVFRAPADPTRRSLLDELFKQDGQTLSALQVRLPKTRFGVMKHLRVLEEAGLVITRRRGREKLHFLNPVPIRLVHDRWVSKYTEPLKAWRIPSRSMSAKLVQSDQAEVLVAEVARDDPGPLQVLRLYRRKVGGASPDRAPKTQGSLAAEAGAEEQPAFRQDEITRDEVGASKLLRDPSGGSVRPISSVRQPVESTGIDEDRRH